MSDIDKLEDLANYQVTATMDGDTYAALAAVLVTWAEEHPEEKDIIQKFATIEWKRTR